MNNKAVSWFLFVLLSLIWGSSFILMKRGMEAYSSDEVAALRIGIAFLSLLPTMIWHYRIDLKKYLPGLLIMGFCGNFIPAFLFTKAETLISSSLAGMLNALTPIFTVIVALIWLKVRPSGNKISGVVIGFLAAVGLMFFDSNPDIFGNFSYSFLVMLATFLYAVSINGIRKYLSDTSSVKATAWAFMFTGPTALIYLFGFSDFTVHLQQSPMAMKALGYTAVLAILGTAISVILYNVLIKRAGVLFASSVTYCIPIVAILWGVFDGEAVHPAQLMSMVVIILSIYLINRR